MAKRIPFPKELGISERGQRRLHRLVNQIEVADVNYHNIDAPGVEKTADAAHKAFELELAKYPGVTAFFPGIFPVLVKDKHNYHVFD